MQWSDKDIILRLSARIDNLETWAKDLNVEKAFRKLLQEERESGWARRERGIRVASFIIAVAALVLTIIFKVNG